MFLKKGNILLAIILAAVIGSTSLLAPQQSFAVPVSNGPVYTWKYIGSYKYNHVALNKTASLLGQAAVSGITYATIGRWIKNDYLKGVASYLAANAVKKIKTNDNYYWTVKKWYDTDARYAYVKEEYWAYKNSKRTKLVYHDFFIKRFLK